MGLADIIEGAVKDFKKRNNDVEVWETLKKKLKKGGLNYEKYCNHDEQDCIIGAISSVGAEKFLKVWDVLNEQLNKHKYNWDIDSNNAKKTFENIRKLCEIDSTEEIIKALAETGYEVPVRNGYNNIFAFLPEESLNLFNTLAKDEMYKEYDLIFKALKRLGYKDIKSYDASSSTQLNYLMKITCLEGDVIGAIYILARDNYQIDKVGGINDRDFKNISDIVLEDKKEKAEGKGGIPIYLYKKGNIELFQEYFNSLETEKKKSVLRSILDYEAKEDTNTNNKLQEWLEKDYKDLLREVGFEDA